MVARGAASGARRRSREMGSTFTFWTARNLR
jgi:hypothetical protein